MTVLPQPSPRDAGVIGFTAHAVIFTDADPEWGVFDHLRERVPGVIVERLKGTSTPPMTTTSTSSATSRKC